MSKDELRRQMPTVAAIVDEFRHLMANGGKVVFAQENGHTLDRREPVSDEQVFTIPPGYLKPFTPKVKK